MTSLSMFPQELLDFVVVLGSSLVERRASLRVEYFCACAVAQKDAADVQVTPIGRQMERRVVVALRSRVYLAASSDEKQDAVCVAPVGRSVKGQRPGLIDDLVNVCAVPDQPIAGGQMSVAGCPVQRRGAVRRTSVVDVTSVEELVT